MWQIFLRDFRYLMSINLTNYCQFILRKIINFLLQSPDSKMLPGTIAINKMSFIASSLLGTWHVVLVDQLGRMRFVKNRSPLELNEQYFALNFSYKALV